MTHPRHTYLFAEGDWRLICRAWDKEGAEYPLDGETQVRHEPSGWFSRSRLRLRRDPPQEWENLYEIDPFVEGRESASWRAQDPALGDLNGTFAVVGDTILSSFTGGGSRLVGVEFLLQESEGLYHVRGFLAHDGVVISRWSGTLTRKN